MVAVEAAATPSRRFALLMAARDSDYVLKKYGGYLHVFVAAFGGAGGRKKVMPEMCRS